MSKKKRHKWGKVQTNLAYMDYQKCIKCGLYRQFALGIWHYTKDDPKNLETTACMNDGCI